MNLKTAALFVRLAFWCGIISFFVTFTLAVLGLVAPGTDFGFGGASPLYFIDAALILACVIGLLFKSRVAAIVLAVHFIASRTLMGIPKEEWTSVVSFLFSYVYIQAAVAAFYYHAAKKREAIAG